MFFLQKKGFLDVFAEKKKEIPDIFANFPEQQIIFTEEYAIFVRNNLLHIQR